MVRLQRTQSPFRDFGWDAKEHKATSVESKHGETMEELYNRAESLALESVILATRLQIAKANYDLSLINMIYSKITENIEAIRRFGKNKNALEVIDVILKHIKFLIDD